MSEAKPQKKRGKRGAITAGVVAAIVVVAGIGLFVWHEQPSFCAAICHTPMDAYYDTYETGETDKYGNEVPEGSRQAMMAFSHKANEGTTCMGCHVPTLSEQINEGIEWVSGNYEVVGYNPENQWLLETRSLDKLTEARGISGDEFCLNESCHNITREELTEKTADLDRNPHASPHEDYSCDTCHKAHTQSTNYCLQCHSDAPLPEGWVTPSQAIANATVSR